MTTPDDKTEREHLKQLLQPLWRTDCDNWRIAGFDEHLDLLVDVVKAARQEGYNAHLEQLAKHAQPTEDEREHCERVVSNAVETDELGREFVQVLVSMLLRERAALRAEYEAKLKSAVLAERDRVAPCAEAYARVVDERDATNAEIERLRAELAQAQLRVARLEHDLEDLEDNYDADVAAARAEGYAAGLKDGRNGG